MSFSKEQALHFFKKAISENRLGHAYLLTGSTTKEVGIVTEELAALVLGCTLLHLETHPDFYLIEPESKARKILTEQMRMLEEALALSPQVSTYKVVIIHDADRMVPAAANAFLKTLEEPPDQTLLLLTTTLPEALLQTIRSRCIILPLHQTEKAPQEMYEQKMEELAASFFKPGAPTDATAAFQLTRAFQLLLTAAREEAVEAADQEFKDEKNHYGKTTDAPWEGRREEHFKATAAASALGYRSLLLGTLATYFGNRLRALYERPAEHDDDDVVRLLRSLDVVESMRNTLEQGVQEALTLEAGFLELMEVYRK
jgi:DNA polymerase-3 subunit delta'